MSLFDPVPQVELTTRYTHYGWFCGLVPIYMGDIDSDSPLVVERNWVPTWWFWAVEFAFGVFCQVCDALSPDFVPSFPMLITGEIKR